MTRDLREYAQMAHDERIRRGWSAEETATRAGMSPVTWLRIEHGKPVRELTYGKVDRLFGSSGPPKAETYRANLRSLREHMEMSQEEIGRRMSDFCWSQTTTWKVESGGRGLSFAEGMALARIFDVTAEDLFYGEVKPAPRCQVCGGSPPRGFTCNDCGVTA